jgi:hypothetical protein
MTISFPVREIGKRGLRYDVQPVDVPIGDLTDIRNARWSEGALSNMPAPATVHTDGSAEAVRFVAPWNIDAGDAIVVIAETTWTLKRSGFADVDVTPASYTDSEYWYSDVIGDACIITNGVDEPFWLQVADIGVSPFATLDGWPSAYRAEVIISFRGRLVALRVSVSGTFQPGLVKTSHPYSPGDTTTFWDFTNPQLRATENQRQFAGRTLVGGARVRDFLLLLYDRGVEVMQLAPSNDPTKVYTFRSLFEDDGMVSPHAFAELPGFVVVAGNHDIYVTDGLQRTSLTDRKITQWYARNVDFTQPIFVAYWPRRNEFHVSLRTQEDTPADVNLIYSQEVQAWFRQDSTDGGGTGLWVQLVVGPTLGADNPVYADYPSTTYSELNDTSYADLFTNVESDTLYAVVGSTVIDVDPLAPASSYARKFSIQNSVLDLDKLRDNVGASIAHLSRIFPQVRSATAAQINFRVGARANPNAGAELEDPVSFDSVDDYAVDVRTAGRYLTIQISEDPSNTALFNMSGFDLELDQAGDQ